MRLLRTRDDRFRVGRTRDLLETLPTACHVIRLGNFTIAEINDLHPVAAYWLRLDRAKLYGYRSSPPLMSFERDTDRFHAAIMRALTGPANPNTFD